MPTRPTYSQAQIDWGTARGHYIDPNTGYMRNSSGGMVIPPMNPPATPATPAPPAPTGPTAAQQSARALIENTLRDWGLESLSGWAWDQILAGNTEMLPQLIRQTEQYKQRFAGNEARRARGLNVLSEGEYLSLENSYRSVMRSYGLPQGAFDSQTDLAELISGDVSPGEINDRLRVYQDAAYQAPAEVRNQLSTLFGITEGGLIAYYIDPDRALPLLQQQYMAAGAASAAMRGGLGQLSVDQATRLGQLGATANDVDAFSQISRSGELFTGLGGSEIDQSTMSAYQAAEGTFGGNKEAADLLRKRAEQRVAQFRGGGAFAQTAGGVVGIGTAGS